MVCKHEYMNNSPYGPEVKKKNAIQQSHIINLFLGAVHMSRASPANRADLSHENLYFLTT